MPACSVHPFLTGLPTSRGFPSRRTKKWESHIWYNKKQLDLGGFKEAVDAAKAHDIMALKLRGSKAHTNFEPNGYARLLPFLEALSMVSRTTISRSRPVWCERWEGS